jgi:hypothetical protein
MVLYLLFRWHGELELPARDGLGVEGDPGHGVRLPLILDLQGGSIWLLDTHDYGL